MASKNKRFFILYWVLLLYVIAALVFWFIELDKQNRRMTAYRLSELVADDIQYEKKYDAILSEKNRKNAQYLGEGVTFLALIIVGAVFLYRALRRQFLLQKQQENFMMAVTHELKTPIAVTKLNLETMQKHQLDEAKKQRLLQMTLQETNRLNALASNILVSAQLEGTRSREKAKEDIDFSGLVKNCVHDFMSRFPDRHWHVDIDDEADLRGDPLLLEIMVNNLLENAVKYSPARSALSCSLKVENTHVVLNVADEGPGIPAEEKARVFEKFYRIGNEQTRSAKGTGLGLYLCSRIAASHHATIRIHENMPKGAVFTVRIPKSTQS